MASNFDSSILENLPRGDKTADENVYINTEETLGREYCDLVYNNASLTQTRHPSTTGSGNPNSHNSHTNDSRLAKRHKRVTLQDTARRNGEGLTVSSTNRVRTRLVSDSQLITHSSRYPDESNLTRITDIHSKNAPSNSGSTGRTQPSITSKGRRKISEGTSSSYSYLNQGISDDLPGNSQNAVITEQPKPLGMVLRQEERNVNFASADKREDILTNGMENRQNFARKAMGEDPRARNRVAGKPDLNMNRAKAEARVPNGKTENGRDRIAKPTMQKQSSREERSVNYKGQREEPKTDNRGEKQSQLPSHVSLSTPHRHLEIMNRDANDSTTRENQTKRGNEDIELTTMAPVCNPRIPQLQREETPAKNPLLGLAFPRPHSFDILDNKTKVSRTFSSPELRKGSLEELLGNTEDGKRSEGSKDVDLRHKNNVERCSRYSNQASNNTLKAIVKIKGKRSKSLPVTGNIKTSSSMGRRGQHAEANPLRYFAYLNKRFQFRERLHSAHNILSARPVILTSTTVVSPEVTTNFCQQLECQDADPCDDAFKHQGACQDLIDCCTCMCCVKALFYHCTKDDESEGHCAEHPCSCTGPDGGCLCRWSVLGMLSLVMPCMLCYLPVQGCTLAVEYCRRSTPDSSEQ